MTSGRNALLRTPKVPVSAAKQHPVFDKPFINPSSASATCPMKFPADEKCHIEDKYRHHTQRIRRTGRKTTRRKLKLNLPCLFWYNQQDFKWQGICGRSTPSRPKPVLHIQVYFRAQVITFYWHSSSLSGRHSVLDTGQVHR